MKKTIKRLLLLFLSMLMILSVFAGLNMLSFAASSINDMTYKDIHEEVKHMHSYVSTVTLEPTCTSLGIMTYTCECGDRYTDIIGKAAHTEEIIEGKAATCTETGLTDGTKCSVCNEIFVPQIEIPATGHDYISVVTKEAACSEYGVITYICASCGDSYTENISSFGHTEEIIEGKSATCTEDGLTDGVKCAVCGEVLKVQEEIPALGHTEETVKGKNATCTERGLTDGVKCAICGKVVTAQEEIPALGHTEKTVTGKDATCTKTGLTDGVKCAVCGKVITAQTEIPALGHTEETVAGKNATCSKKGLTDGVKCTVCNKVLIAQTEIPAFGHTEEVVTGKAATCTEKGSTNGVKCAVCGDTLIAQKNTAALGHKKETVIGKAATCTEQGLTDGVKCAVCGEILTAQKIISTLDHSYSDWTTTKEPTETETGTKTAVCIVCGYTKTESIAKLPTNPTIDLKSDSSITVNESIVKVQKKMTVKYIKSALNNSHVSFVDADGNALKGNAVVGTGSKIQILDKDGNVLSMYDILVPMDLTGDGKITAADARLTLRQSAKLENFDGVYLLAANADGIGDVTAADARKILRVSASLEK